MVWMVQIGPKKPLDTFQFFYDSFQSCLLLPCTLFHTCRPWSLKNSPVFSITCSSDSWEYGCSWQKVKVSHSVTPNAHTSLAVVNFPWMEKGRRKNKKEQRQNNRDAQLPKALTGPQGDNSLATAEATHRSTWLSDCGRFEFGVLPDGVFLCPVHQLGVVFWGTCRWSCPVIIPQTSRFSIFPVLNCIETQFDPIFPRKVQSNSAS